MTSIRQQTIHRLTEQRDRLAETVRQIDAIIAWLSDGRQINRQVRPYDVETADPEQIAERYGLNLDPDGDILPHVAARLDTIRRSDRHAD